jgi:hypothetical protein
VKLEIAQGQTNAYSERENWDAWDPMLIAEGLFAAANIFRLHLNNFFGFQNFEKRKNQNFIRFFQFQFLKVSVHIFGESVFGATSNLSGSDGDGHHEVLSSLHPRLIRFLLR